MQAYNTYTFDYYPFGMVIPGRSYSTTAYKWGFNGKEKDDEVSGSGNQYDYGFRIYNPRIAKFLSVDPLTQGFPFWSPYHFAGNTPIQAIDLDGLEILDFRKAMYRMTTGTSRLNNETSVEIINIPIAIRSLANGNNGIYFTLNKTLPSTTGSEDAGLSFKANISEGRSQPDFWGLAESAPLSSSEESQSAYKKGWKSTAYKAVNGFATTADAVEHFVGIWGNQSNVAIWTGNTAEKENRKAYYLATGLVDKYGSKLTDAVSGGYATNAQARSDLVNYILDGTLPKADMMQKFPWGGSSTFRSSYQGDYIYRLISFGNNLMKNNNIELRNETKERNGKENASLKAEKNGNDHYLLAPRY